MQERLRLLKQVATSRRRSTPLQQQPVSAPADIDDDDDDGGDNAVDLTHLFPRRAPPQPPVIPTTTSTPAEGAAAAAAPASQLPLLSATAITTAAPGWRQSATKSTPMNTPDVQGGRRGGGWRPKKVKCKEQLRQCQDRLANCMRILHWRTIDGKSFSSVPKFEIPSQLVATPMIAPRRRKQVRTSEVAAAAATASPTPVKTPRPKRTRAPPKRFILSSSSGSRRNKR